MPASGASHVTAQTASAGLAIAACALATDTVNPAQPFVVVPAGEFRGLDGRPVELKTGWICDDRNGPALAEKLNSRKVDMVVDYDHQTLNVEKNGQKALAAGWLKAGQFEYVSGVGIVNNQPSWTKAAANHLAEGEYRYRSPVLVYDGAGVVRDVINVALTNQPNLDVLSDVTLASLSQQYGTAVSPAPQTPQENPAMNPLLVALLPLLGLPSDIAPDQAEAQALAKLDELKATATQETGVTVAENSQTLFDAMKAAGQKIATNSQATGGVDPSQYVPIAVVHELQAELAKTQSTNEVEPLVQAALSDGRLRGDAMADWARNIGMQKGAAELQSTLAGMPKLAALSQKQTTVITQGGVPEIDPTIAQISAQFGNDAAEVSKML